MYEKLVKYAAKQLEIDASEINPDSTFDAWASTPWTLLR